MTTNLDLYEALKKHLHEEAARVIAEAIPLSDQLATRTDLEAVRLDLKGEIHRVEAAVYRWMLTFFATLFLGMGGMIVAIVLKA